MVLAGKFTSLGKGFGSGSYRIQAVNDPGIRTDENRGGPSSGKVQAMLGQGLAGTDDNTHHPAPNNDAAGWTDQGWIPTIGRSAVTTKKIKFVSPVRSQAIPAIAGKL